MNEDDIALYESPLYAEATKTCTGECLMDADPKTCGSLCYQQELGLSVDCADCFGGHFECITTACSVECVDNTDPALCTPCIYKRCSQGLADCSGLPISTPPNQDTTGT